MRWLFRTWLVWPVAALVSVMAALQAWGLVNRMPIHANNALLPFTDLASFVAIGLFTGAAAATGPLLVAVLRGGLTPRRAGQAAAAAIATGVVGEGLPGLVSTVDHIYRVSHDFAAPSGALELLGVLSAPLLFLSPLLALGAAALVVLPAPPGSARLRVVTLLFVGVPVALAAGVAMLVMVTLALRSGEPWSGFNQGVVAGAWAAATVLLLILNRHARFLRRWAVEPQRPPSAAARDGR